MTGAGWQPPQRPVEGTQRDEVAAWRSVLAGMAAEAAAERRPARRRDSGLGGGAWLGLAVFLVAAGVGLAGVQRPAYWVDEATTLMLVHWHWHDLLGVISGPEAPLGPYYLLMKPWTEVSSAEWWVRLPSVVPLAAAVAVLAVWARRRLGLGSALAGASVMIALPAFSRFAQEVRPYGLMVLAGTLCALAWWSWTEQRRRASALRYAAGVAVLPLLHALALTLVAAQLLAALLGGRRGERFRLALTGAGLAVLGVLPVLPYLVLVRRQAMGVAYPLPLTWSHAWTTWAASVGGPPREDRLTGVLALAVLVLAGLGLLGLREAGSRRVLGYLACWAVVPPVLLAVAAVRAETLVARYFMVSLPAWSLLAGHGCALLGRAVARLLSGQPVPARSGPEAGHLSGQPVLARPGRERLARAAGTLVAALSVLGLAVAGLPHQTLYRTPAGHGNGDVRPAVALLNTPEYRGLPVVVLPEAWWVIPANAYDPALPSRTILAVGPGLGADRHIVLAALDPAAAAARLTSVRSLAALVYAADPRSAESAVRRSPLLAGFTVSTTQQFDGWAVQVLIRAGV